MGKESKRAELSESGVSSFILTYKLTAPVFRASPGRDHCPRQKHSSYALPNQVYSVYLGGGSIRSFIVGSLIAPDTCDVDRVLLALFMMKGVGDISESSMSVRRRRYENSQMRKNAIVPAILPTTIPAMAPAVRDFDERGKVEVEVALGAANSVGDKLDREDGVDFESEID